MAGFSNRSRQYSRKGSQCAKNVSDVQRVSNFSRLMDFPVRIEDSVLVGNSNCRLLLELKFGIFLFSHPVTPNMLQLL